MFGDFKLEDPRFSSSVSPPILFENPADISLDVCSFLHLEILIVNWNHNFITNHIYSRRRLLCPSQDPYLIVLDSLHHLDGRRKRRLRRTINLLLHHIPWIFWMQCLLLIPSVQLVHRFVNYPSMRTNNLINSRCWMLVGEFIVHTEYLNCRVESWTITSMLISNSRTSLICSQQLKHRCSISKITASMLIWRTSMITSMITIHRTFFFTAVHIGCKLIPAPPVFYPVAFNREVIRVIM